MPDTTSRSAKAEAHQEDIAAQIEALRADLAKLTATITGEVRDGIETAGRKIDQTRHDAQATATRAVLDHPLAAVGIAAAIGLLIGLSMRKG